MPSDLALTDPVKRGAGRPNGVLNRGTRGPLAPEELPRQLKGTGGRAGKPNLSAGERLYEAKAELAEIEVAKARATVLDAKAVAAYQLKREATIRARLLAIPSAVAPQIAVPGKVAQAESVIRRAIYEALAELGDDGGRK